MTRENYIKRVLAIMNEAGWIDLAGSFMIGSDTAMVDRYIEDSFVDSWRRCAGIIPKSLFNSESFTDALIFPDLVSGSGYVILPADFYLLAGFKMRGWMKPVYDAQLDNELTASIQSNEYTRGSEIRPVCIISSRIVEGAVQRVLNYYSLRRGMESHEIEEALYLPFCKPLTEYGLNEDLNLNHLVIEILAYLSASTVFTLFEKHETAKALEQIAVDMFPGSKSVRGMNVTINQ
jgi:hypothetical protein